ncbi:MAG: nitronate monooxygenase, partial [Candidatus Spyradocola sp.]
ECTIHPNYKQRVLKAKDIDTMVTGRRVGHPARGLKSPVARRMQELEYSEGFTAEEFERLGVGAMRKAAREGDEQNGSFMCGQIAGLVKKEQPAAEIIREMFDEAEALLKGAAQWVR